MLAPLALHQVVLSGILVCLIASVTIFIIFAQRDVVGKEEKMADVELDKKLLSDATVTVLDKEITNLLAETDNIGNSDNKGDNDIILYVVIAIIVIAVIAGGVFIFIKQKNNVKAI